MSRTQLARKNQEQILDIVTDDYISLENAIEYLGVNRSSVYKHVTKNGIIRYKYNSRVYFQKLDIEKIKINVNFNKRVKSTVTIRLSPTFNEDRHDTHDIQVEESVQVNNRNLLLKENIELNSKNSSLRQELDELYIKYISSLEQSKYQINELANKLAEMNKAGQVLLMDKLGSKKKGIWGPIKSLFK